MRHLAAAALCALLTSACSGEQDNQPVADAKTNNEADAGSVATTADDPAPKTADCRSWAELDTASLPPLPDSPHSETFDRVWTTLLEKHYDPTLGCLDWPAIRTYYGDRVAKAPDTKAAYVELNAMLDTLGQSHLAAVPPGDRTDGATRQKNTGPALAPLAARVIDGKAIVTSTSLEGHESGVPRGAQLVEIDGNTVDVATQWHLDGEGREEAKRLYAARAVGSMLHCPDGGLKRLKYLDPAAGDAEVEREVECVMPQATETLGNLRNVPVRVNSRMIDGTKIGYLAFNVWMVPLMNARLRPALAQLREQGMQALVLDLRGNPGGVGAMSIPLARELVTEAVDLGALQMRNMKQEFKVEANPEAFAGPVVLLIDEGTASTSEIFATGMRDAGRVQVVGGSNSAGMALPSLMEELPDGGRLQYVVGDYKSPKGTVAEGDGVRPDVLVAESRAEYAAGRDAVLDAGVELATKLMGEEK